MPGLFAQPFSSYCQKALIALYENDTASPYRSLDDPAEHGVADVLAFGKFPVLIDDGVAVAETSVIGEQLDLRHPGSVRSLPADAEAALAARFMERVFDNHVMAQTQLFVEDAMRPIERRDAVAVAKAAAALDTAYAWLDTRMADRE